jgi:hypothetical protein
MLVMPDERYDPKYEHRIRELAENRLKTGNYKVFDSRARIITRRAFPELKDAGSTQDERCLVIINAAGETIVITAEFELALRGALSVKK